MSTGTTHERVPLDPAHSSGALRRATTAQEMVVRLPHIGTDELRRTLGGTAPRRQVSKHEIVRLRDQGALLGVRCGRHGFLHPAFQIDVDQGQLVPVVAKVNRMLRRRLDVEETLRWWLATSSTTGVRRLQCLHRVPDLLAELDGPADPLRQRTR